MTQIKLANLLPITRCSQKHRHIPLIINVKFALFANADCGPRAVSVNEVLLNLSPGSKFIHWKINRKTTWGLLGVINVFGIAVVL